MPREILTSHVSKENLRGSLLFSLLGHVLLLAFFFFALELLPEGEPIVLGTGAGGGQGEDVLTVGLTAELSAGAGMYKPSLTPQPKVVPPPPPEKEEPAPPPEPDKTVFLEESKQLRPKEVEKKPEKTEANTPLEKPKSQPPQISSRSEEKPAEPARGQIPTRPEPGAGGPGGRAAGSGGGFGPGSGVQLGSGTGEGIFDSWYARQVERRIGENWLKGLMGELKRTVQTVISFEIRPDGRIEGIQIEKSSGIGSVDRAAQRAVEASNPLPPLPYEFRNRRVKFIAHFQYPPR
ncbi:MAG: energy transducer TonB [Acidobacteriota bacterium]